MTAIVRREGLVATALENFDALIGSADRLTRARWCVFAILLLVQVPLILELVSWILICGEPHALAYLGIVSAPVSICLAGFLLPPWRNRYLIPGWIGRLLVTCFIAIAGVGGALVINRLEDRSPGEFVDFPVVGKWSYIADLGNGYGLLFEDIQPTPWAGHWRYTGGVEVTRAEYDAALVGQTRMRLTARPGYLGVRWLSPRGYRIMDAPG